MDGSAPENLALVPELRVVMAKLRDHAEDAQVWKQAAQLFQQGGRSEQALRAWRNALRFDPQDASIAVELARCLIDLRCPQEALVVLQSAARSHRHHGSIQDAVKALAQTPIAAQQRLGVQVHPVHFYSPVNDLAFLESNPQLWRSPADPLDVDWNVEGQLKNLRAIARHVPELADVPEGPVPRKFCWNNNFFTNTSVEADGSFVSPPNPVPPGAYVELAALMDLICVVSSCPFDLAIEGWTINADHGPSELLVDVQ